MAKKISIKAICSGLAVGLIGSTIASLILVVLWGIPLKPEALTAEKLEAFYATNVILLVVDLFFSLVFVFFSGYITAKLSKANPMPNVITMALIQLVLLILIYTLQSTVSPLWYTVITFLSLVPVAYWGGKIATRVKS